MWPSILHKLRDVWNLCDKEPSIFSTSKLKQRFIKAVLFVLIEITFQTTLTVVISVVVT